MEKNVAEKSIIKLRFFWIIITLFLIFIIFLFQAYNIRYLKWIKSDIKNIKTDTWRTRTNVLKIVPKKK